MKIFHDIRTYSSSRPACVTTGTFDGVHIGHRKILSQLSEMAREGDMESVLLTFDPHPRKVLFPEQNDLRLLTTLEEKLHLLSQTGIDAVVIQPFTREFSRTTALQYVRDLLVEQLKMSKLVIGYDHQFGKNREGSIEQLQELAPMLRFEVVEIPAQDIDHVHVSSTKVRQALAEGDIASANLYLGYPYFLSGIVVDGNKRGRSMGYPTANIRVPASDKLIPRQGVYAVKAFIDDARFKGKSFGGMLNIGFNPTFESSGVQSIEVHLFDFNEDIYHMPIRLGFHHRIRDELKFQSVDELVRQLDVDRVDALDLLAS